MSRKWSGAQRSAALCVSAFLSLSLPTACKPENRGSRSVVNLQQPTHPLTTLSVVDLGVLAPTQTASASLVVRNTLDSVVTVSRIETSCPCVRVLPHLFHVGPLAEVKLTVHFDPVEEPDFRGPLSVDYYGRESSGDIEVDPKV